MDKHIVSDYLGHTDDFLTISTRCKHQNIISLLRMQWSNPLIPGCLPDYSYNPGSLGSPDSGIMQKCQIQYTVYELYGDRSARMTFSQNIWSTETAQCTKTIKWKFRPWGKKHSFLQLNSLRCLWLVFNSASVTTFTSCKAKVSGHPEYQQTKRHTYQTHSTLVPQACGISNVIQIVTALDELNSPVLTTSKCWTKQLKQALIYWYIFSN